MISENVDVVEQEEGCERDVYYEVAGLYTDETREKYRKINFIGSSPPKIHFCDSKGMCLTLVMTKEFSAAFEKDIHHINRAYMGYSYPEKKATLLERIKGMPSDMKKDPVPYVIGILILIGVLMIVF